MSEFVTWRDDAAALLSAYIRFDTSNPPGDEMPAARWLRDQVAARGITDDITLYEPAPGRGLVLARVGAEPLAGAEPLKPLVLTHHIDVVPADPAQWSHPPFAGDVADGYVWGRGALDTKCQGVIYLLALARLRREGARFRRPVVLLAVPDEETNGALGMAWLVERHLAELDPQWVWDEGASGYQGLLGDEGSGPVVFGIGVAEKRVNQLRLVATGEPGHASRPLADDAPRALLRAVRRLLRPRPVRLHAVTRAMFAELATHQSFPSSFLWRHLDVPLVWRAVGPRLAARDYLMNAMLRDTVSLTMLQGGYKINVVPERAEAGLDCRLLPDTDEDAFLADIRRSLGNDPITVEVLDRSVPAGISPLEGPFYGALRAALLRSVPESAVVPLLQAGATDASLYRVRGIPAYGSSPFVLPRQEQERVHGIDERISLGNLLLGAQVVYDVVRALCVEE